MYILKNLRNHKNSVINSQIRVLLTIKCWTNRIFLWELLFYYRLCKNTEEEGEKKTATVKFSKFFPDKVLNLFLIYTVGLRYVACGTSLQQLLPVPFLLQSPTRTRGDPFVLKKKQFLRPLKGGVFAIINAWNFQKQICSLMVGKYCHTKWFGFENK